MVQIMLKSTQGSWIFDSWLPFLQCVFYSIHNVTVSGYRRALSKVQIIYIEYRENKYYSRKFNKIIKEMLSMKTFAN